MMHENELSKKAEELNKMMDEFMNYFTSKFGMDMVRYSEPEDILMLKNVMKMYDLSKDFIESYAKKFDEMDRKLDLILKKLEK